MQVQDKHGKRDQGGDQDHFKADGMHQPHAQCSVELHFCLQPVKEHIKNIIPDSGYEGGYQREKTCGRQRNIQHLADDNRKNEISDNFKQERMENPLPYAFIKLNVQIHIPLARLPRYPSIIRIKHHRRVNALLDIRLSISGHFFPWRN